MGVVLIHLATLPQALVWEPRSPSEVLVSSV